MTQTRPNLVLQGCSAGFCFRPDTQVIQREGWHQLLTPSVKVGGLNEVIVSQVTPGEEELVFDKVWSQYAAHKARFKWNTGYWTEPKSFEKFLASQTGERAPTQIRESHGMALDVPRGLKPYQPKDITILEISAADAARDASLVQKYAEGFAATWGPEIPGGNGDALKGEIEPMRESVELELRQNPGSYFYVALHEGKPVGISAVILRPTLRVGYFTMAAVTREMRGRGLYRAFVEARLARLAHEGYDLGVTWALANTSAPILSKLGWKIEFSSKAFHFAP